MSLTNDPAWFRALPDWAAKRYPRRVHRVHDERYNLMVEAVNKIAAIIPDNGTLEGTYTGNVLCEGDATLTDDVVVNGNLIVLGELTNSGGHELTVRGSVSAKDLYFARSPSSAVQGNIFVDGDFICTYLDFPQSGGSAAILRVGGDLIVAAGGGGNVMNCQGVSGVSGSPGATIIVYGDLVAGPVNVEGGSASNGNAGNGGNVEVYGSLVLEDDIDLSGGDSTTGGNAGNGGYLEVRGTLHAGFCSIRITGGYAGGGNAGNGGGLSVDGDVLTNNLFMFGGYCDSTDPAHRAGSGGFADIDGGLTANSDVEFQGGDRAGTVTGPGTQSAANGGNLNVYGGPITLDTSDILLYGGSVNTGASSPHPGGSGGSLSAAGYVSASELNCNGGDDGTTNGSAGSAYLRAGASIVQVRFLDGGGAGSAPTATSELVLTGSCCFDSVDMTDRPGCKIFSDFAPAILKINSMSDKTTLNDSGGTATGDISLVLSDSLFASSAGSTWYTFSGTAT